MVTAEVVTSEVVTSEVLPPPPNKGASQFINLMLSVLS